MKIEVLYEDLDVLAIHKPTGVIVNNADSVKEETIQSWAHKYLHLPDQPKPQVSAEKPLSDGTFDYEQMFLQRSGVVHRLDKETSGILLIGKNARAFELLQKQFKDRETHKTYLTLVHGIVAPQDGEINAPVGRLPWNRTQFGVVAGGREAQTTYKTISNFQFPTSNQINTYSYLEVTPLTGRTHQIRVHMKHLNHPVVADTLYAGRKVAARDREDVPRLFLHATSLVFTHPITNKEMKVVCPLPEDLQEFLDTCTQIG